MREEDQRTDLTEQQKGPRVLLTRRMLLGRVGLTGLAAVGVPALLAACTTPQGGQPSSGAAATQTGAVSPSPPNVLPVRLGIPVGPDLNPAKMSGWGYYFGTFASAAYAPILHMRPDGTFDGGLATTWRFLSSAAASFRDFEFTLRKDARFSDGVPVNAQAVAGWLDYFARAQGPYASSLGANPKFDVADDWTVRIHVADPTPLLPWYLSDAHAWGLVASPRAVADPTLLTNGTVGAGPYMLDPSQSVKANHYTFVPNPYYYDKPALNFSEVDIKIIGVGSSMLQAMQSGQIDAGYGDPTTFAAAESSGLSLATVSAGMMLLNMNPRLAPQFADVRVRQALNYAIDRGPIAQATEGKYGSGTSEFITSDADPGLRNYYPYDPAKAKSLLAAAGYPTGFKVDFLSYHAESGSRGPTLAQAVAKYLEAVGVQTNLIVPPNIGAWLSAQKTAPLYAVSAAIAPTAAKWPVNVQPDVASWGGHFDDPTMVELYYNGFGDADPTVSWKKMWELITMQAYYVPLTVNAQGWYFSKSIAGFNPTVERFGTVLLSEMQWKK